MGDFNKFKKDLQTQYLQSLKECIAQNNNQYDEHIFYALRKTYTDELTHEYFKNQNKANSLFLHLFSPQAFIWITILNFMLINNIGIMVLHLIVSALFSEQLNLFKQPQGSTKFSQLILELLFPKGFMLISLLYFCLDKINYFALHLFFTLITCEIFNGFVKISDIKNTEKQLNDHDLEFKEFDYLEQKYKLMNSTKIQSYIKTNQTHNYNNHSQSKNELYKIPLDFKRSEVESEFNYYSQKKYYQKDIDSLLARYSLSNIQGKIKKCQTIILNDLEEVYLCIFLTHGKYEDNWTFLTSTFSNNQLKVEIKLLHTMKNVTLTFE